MANGKEEISVGLSYVDGVRLQQNRLAVFSLLYNQLSGCVPSALDMLRSMTHLQLLSNNLQGYLPDGIANLLQLQFLQLTSNNLRGPLQCSPNLWTMEVSKNAFTGAIPLACGHAHISSDLDIQMNQLSGSLPDSIAHRWTVQNFQASCNRLSGALPSQWLLSLAHSGLSIFGIENNQIRGTLPDVLSRAESLCGLDVSHNELSGALPRLPDQLLMLVLADNRMTISFDRSFASKIVKPDLQMLQCGGNMLEGSIPARWLRPAGYYNLMYLDIAGRRPTASGARLHGYIPSSLGRAANLMTLAAQDHAFEGDLPSLPYATLVALTLQGNMLRTMPDLTFDSQPAANTSVILLQNNLFSCGLPRMRGGTRVRFSLVGFGNMFRHPGQRFPSWISPFEQDSLFWTSGREGTMLIMKLVSAAALLLGTLSMERKRVRKALMRTSSGWESATGAKSVLLQICVQITSCISLRALGSLVLILALFCWDTDMYRCPQTLTFVTAALHNCTAVHLLAILFWWSVWLHPSLQNLVDVRIIPSLSVQGHCTAMRCFLWLLWAQLAMMLSTLVVLNLAAKSIPGFFAFGNIISKLINAFIGAAQGTLSGMVIPSLAKRLPHGQHAYMLADFLVSYLLPAAMVLYLDRACFGHWSAWWELCIPRHADLLKVMIEAEVQWGGSVNPAQQHQVLSRSDVCSHSRQTSMASCFKTALLRLQDLWLGKWITVGLLLPVKELLMEPSMDKVLQKLALAMELAVIAAGPLPILTPLLYVVVLVRFLLTALAQEKRTSSKHIDGSVIKPSWRMTQVLSLILYVGFVSGDQLSTAALFLLVAMAALEGSKSVGDFIATHE